MQSSLRNRLKHATPVKLQAGGGIRFGFMRQNNLSGRTLNVTDVVSYLFEEDCFAAYQLRDEETDISVILVEEPNPMESYMAISFQLKDKWCSSLFAKLPPKQWFKLVPEETVPVDQNHIVMPQGWLVEKYSAVLTTKGRKLGGDMRSKKPSEIDEKKAETFEYVLLVSENGEYALEAEKYDNGRIKVMATVYRPMTDIIETTSFHKPYIVTDNENEGEIEDKTEQAIEIHELTAEESKEATTIIEASAKAESAKAEVVTAEMPMEAKTEEKAAPVAQKTLTQTEMAVSAASQATAAAATHQSGALEMSTVIASVITAPGYMLSCNSVLTARLLDEAQRNKLSLEDVIRKVIDLPRESVDVVYVPLALSDKEKEALIKRYKVADFNEVQQQIVSELKEFAGVK